MTEASRHFVTSTRTEPFRISAVLQQLADAVSLNGPVTDLGAFANSYIEVFSRGYNLAFGIAAIAMVISLLAYLIFHKHLPKREKAAGERTITLREKPLAIPVALVAGAITAVSDQLC